MTEEAKVNNHVGCQLQLEDINLSLGQANNEIPQDPFMVCVLRTIQMPASRGGLLLLSTANMQAQTQPYSLIGESLGVNGESKVEGMRTT